MKHNIIPKTHTFALDEDSEFNSVISYRYPVRLQTAPTGSGAKIELPNYLFKLHEEQHVYSSALTWCFRSRGAVCDVTIHSTPLECQNFGIGFSINIALRWSAKIYPLTNL